MWWSELQISVHCALSYALRQALPSGISGGSHEQKRLSYLHKRPCRWWFLAVQWRNTQPSSSPPEQRSIRTSRVLPHWCVVAGFKRWSNRLREFVNNTYRKRARASRIWRFHNKTMTQWWSTRGVLIIPRGGAYIKWSLWRSARYAEASDTRDQAPRDATLHNPQGDNGHVPGRLLPSRHVKRVHSCSHDSVER